MPRYRDPRWWRIDPLKHWRIVLGRVLWEIGYVQQEKLRRAFHKQSFQHWKRCASQQILLDREHTWESAFQVIARMPDRREPNKLCPEAESGAECERLRVLRFYINI